MRTLLLDDREPVKGGFTPLGTDMHEAWQALYWLAERNGFSGGHEAWTRTNDARRIRRAADDAAPEVQVSL